VPDDGELAKIALEDELGQKLGLIARRVTLVEGLVGAAEALEVDGDDLVVAGEVRRDMPPGEGVGAEAVDQQDGGPFAALDRVELYRRVRRPSREKGSWLAANADTPSPSIAASLTVRANFSVDADTCPEPSSLW
jgi:hypothetical protein